MPLRCMSIPSNTIREKIISMPPPLPPTEKAKHVRRLRRLKISSGIVITIGLGCGLGTILTLNELMEVLSRRLPDLSEVIFPFLFGFLTLAGIISSLILLSFSCQGREGEDRNGTNVHEAQNSTAVLH